MLLLLACTRPVDTSAAPDSAPPDTDPPAPLTCPEAGEAVTSGALDSTSLNEVSGVVESRQNSDVLWVHNDSGDEPRLYAISTAGALKSTWLLTGAPRGDWEDLAIGGDGTVINQARRVVKNWMAFCNAERPHSALDRLTPDDAYSASLDEQKAA